IRIAERILEEIFAPQDSGQQLMGFRTGSIRGEYLPGVGVHFTINQTRQFRIRAAGAESNQYELSPEDFEMNVMEYITNYAAQLRNIEDDEQIRITYGTGASGGGVIIIRGSDQTNRISRAGYTAWIQAGDLRQIAEHGGTATEFREKVTIVNLAETEEKRDLDIFASVLETALNRVDTNELRVNRKPAFQYLPGLGVFYDVNVRSSAGYSISALASDIDKMNLANVHIRMDLGDITDGFDSDFQVNAPRIQIERDSLRIQVQRMGDSLRKDLEGLKLGFVDTRADSVNPQIYSMAGRRLDFNFAERDTIDLSNDAAKLTDEMVEVLKDYGYTLSSLESDEILMITINWQGRNPSLPEKTIIRTTREDLFFGREPVVEEISRR
ncbi:MAG: hypothetical protein JJU37_03775, partial [Balneolaceae bacterium]|nr:hypothetical protein [Balneolaceae bacterium]